MLCAVGSFSHVRLFATPGTVAHQASVSVGFSGREYWSGLPCPPPGTLSNPGIEPTSPTLQADFFTNLATLVALGRGYTYDVMIINYNNNDVGPVRKKTLGPGKCKRRGKRERSVKMMSVKKTLQTTFWRIC